MPEKLENAPAWPDGSVAVDVIVVGAGLAGLTAATELRAKKHSVRCARSA